MLKTFNDHCPRCAKCGGFCKDFDIKYYGGFVTLLLVCSRCQHEFTVLYDNGRILNDK